MSDVDREQFAKDAKSGMSINALAKKHGMQWMAAKNLAQELGEAEGQEPQTGQEEPEPESEPESYGITTNVPSHRIGDLLRGLDFAELADAIDELDSQTKANILQAVMQKKMDRLLEPRDLSPSALELVATAAR